MVGVRHPRWADGVAVAQLISEKWDAVYRICYARLSRREDAEDAAQETFVRLLQTDPRSIRAIDPWLTTVAVRVCAGIHRRRYQHPEYELDPHAAEPHGELDIDAVLGDAWFRRIASALPRSDAEVLTLLYVYPHRRREVAAYLGVSLDHLRVIAFRARRRAQSVLDTLDGFDAGDHLA